MKRFIHLHVIIPTHRIVDYKVGKINSTQLAKNTFYMAYEGQQPTLPLIFYTDLGGNYRSKTFCSYLKSIGVTQSYSRAHIPYDNSVIESFFPSLKLEELYRTKRCNDTTNF